MNSHIRLESEVHFRLNVQTSRKIIINQDRCEAVSSVLEIEHVTMSYPYEKRKLVTIKDITFNIEKNQFVCLLGPSGCGKSTLIRMILGLTKPTSGNMRLNGKDIAEKQGKISVVFQTAALFPWLTVEKNMEIVLEQNIPDRKKRMDVVDKYLKMVGLDGFERAYPKELSGGMRQRVAIARALSTGPDLLLLDEPFVSLDVFSAQAIREELLDLWEKPAIPPSTVLMVTHNVDEAVQLSDKVVVLSKRPGEVISEFPIQLQRPRNTRSDEFYQTVDDVITIMSR